MTTVTLDELREAIERTAERAELQPDPSCPKCGSETVRKVGPWGAYLACRMRSCNGTRRLLNSETSDTERLTALKQAIAYIAEQHVPRCNWKPVDGEVLAGFAFSVMSSW